MHEKKVVHRDIKPSNILMTRLGVVKLCDFGVSGELVNSIAGTFTGTQYYMAPERAMGEGYSITSDVWSLGITLHEFAFLKYPFQPPPRNPIEAITCITRSPIPQMEDGDIKWSANIKDFMSKWWVVRQLELTTQSHPLQSRAALPARHAQTPLHHLLRVEESQHGPLGFTAMWLAL